MQRFGRRVCNSLESPIGLCGLERSQLSTVLQSTSKEVGERTSNLR